MICIAEGILQAQLDGELTNAESLAVERHVAECADCRRRADEVMARHERVHELVYELSPLPSEMTSDPFLALARFKERLATEAKEGGQATMHTLTPIQQLDGHTIHTTPRTMDIGPARRSKRGRSISQLHHRRLHQRLRATLLCSFAIPESGNLITRLIATGAAIPSATLVIPRRACARATRASFHFLLADESFLARFKRELMAAAREFKRDPARLSRGCLHLAQRRRHASPSPHDAGWSGSGGDRLCVHLHEPGDCRADQVEGIRRSEGG